VPNLRTMVTELGTGLGMLGHDDVDEVLAIRSPVMRSLSPEDWDRLSTVRAGGAYRRGVSRGLGERARLPTRLVTAYEDDVPNRWSGRVSSGPPGTKSPR
jgi:hypothetical protein